MVDDERNWVIVQSQPWKLPLLPSRTRVQNAASTRPHFHHHHHIRARSINWNHRVHIEQVDTGKKAIVVYVLLHKRPCACNDESGIYVMPTTAVQKTPETRKQVLYIFSIRMLTRYA
jgi:hypothetical protein